MLAILINLSVLHSETKDSLHIYIESILAYFQFHHKSKVTWATSFLTS